MTPAASATQPAELLTIGETMALVAPSSTAGLSEGAPLTLTAGGAESNVAVGAARLGVRTAWLSRVGADPLGDLVIDSVRRRGVDTSGVRTDTNRPTGLMVKQPSPTGSRVFYYRAGSAASALSPEDLKGIDPPRVVHVSGITAALSESGRALIEAVLGGALATSTTSFDVNYRHALWPSQNAAATTLLKLARSSHIVFVGRDEAELLWGTPTAEDVRALLPGVPHLVVKDGDVEAVEFESDAVTRVPAHHVDVVEPVGAGDAFAAGWLAAWLRGESAEGRLHGGHASAATVLRSAHDIAEPDHEDTL